jgi:hypothetical protein
VVAPSLDRTLSDTFWTVLVPQILQQEPAARHAVLAISALHDHFVATLPSLASSRLDNLTGLTARLGSDTQISSKTAYALEHYNSAIRLVLDDRISNKDILLAVSLLFTCIELLQGGVGAAVKHCQHGVRIHREHPLLPELSAVFYQLGFFSTTFDRSSDLVFSKSNGLRASSPHLVDGLHTVRQAFEQLDAIMARGAGLLRLAQEIRNNTNGAFSIQNLQTEQFHVHRALRLWWEGFTALKTRLKATSPARDRDAAAFRLLEARWRISIILERSCLADNETKFDAYLDNFRRLVDLAQQEKIARGVKKLLLPSFSFDMGYLPLLHIVGMKCRHLRTRIHALVLMKDLSCDREVVWDACFLYACAKFATEFEHGLSLDERRMKINVDSYPDESLPGDMQRIVGFINTGDVSCFVNPDGQRLVRRRVCYYTSGPEGITGPLWDHTTMEFERFY